MRDLRTELTGTWQKMEILFRVDSWSISALLFSRRGDFDTRGTRKAERTGQGRGGQDRTKEDRTGQRCLLASATHSRRLWHARTQGDKKTRGNREYMAITTHNRPRRTNPQHRFSTKPHTKKGTHAGNSTPSATTTPLYAEEKK